MYEIEERFTKSELGIVSWRSQETYHQMSVKMKKNAPPMVPGVQTQKGIIPEGLPKKFFNAEGEVDLRQVTGVEAWNFMRAQGITLPMIPIEERAIKKT